MSGLDYLDLIQQGEIINTKYDIARDMFRFLCKINDMVCHFRKALHHSFIKVKKLNAVDDPVTAINEYLTDCGYVGIPNAPVEEMVCQLLKYGYSFTEDLFTAIYPDAEITFTVSLEGLDMDTVEGLKAGVKYWILLEKYVLELKL